MCVTKITDTHTRRVLNIEYSGIINIDSKNVNQMRVLRIIRVAKKIKKKVVHDFTMKDYKLVIVRIKEISSQL